MKGYRKSQSHANQGQQLEVLLKFVHARYQAAGTACVHKIPTEFIPLRDGTGKVSSVKVEHKSCVDFLGRYKNAPVAVEAKYTENDRMLFSRVEPHQAEFLNDFCRDPEAVGIILVSFKLQRFFAVPWQFWKEARDAWQAGSGNVPISVKAYGWFWDTPGMASASAAQLHPEWEVKAGGTSGLPYLDIIERMSIERRRS